MRWFRTAPEFSFRADDAAAFERFHRDGVGWIDSEASDGAPLPSVPFEWRGVGRSDGEHPLVSGWLAAPEGRWERIRLDVDTGIVAAGDSGRTPVSLTGAIALSAGLPVMGPAELGVGMTAGGRSIGSRALIERMVLGDVRMEAALATVNINKTPADARGDLSNDFFALFDVAVFDWESRRIWLVPRGGARPGFEGWHGVPMAVAGTAVWVACRIDGHETSLLALVDTGATISFVPHELFQRLPGRERGEPMNAGTVVRTVETKSGPYAVNIGGLSLPIRQVATMHDPAVSSVAQLGVESVLGMDALRQRAMALDFGRRMVWFAPEGWVGAPDVRGIGPGG
ncbi:MAG: retroviral-like aspartic protease family protein [Phycisphaerales bacterium]